MATCDMKGLICPLRIELEQRIERYERALREARRWHAKACICGKIIEEALDAPDKIPTDAKDEVAK